MLYEELIFIPQMNNKYNLPQMNNLVPQIY